MLSFVIDIVSQSLEGILQSNRIRKNYEQDATVTGQYNCRI